MAISPKVKYIALGIILFVVIGFLAVSWIYTFGCYSEGDRAGVVSKLSRKGFLFKTYEGQLNLATTSMGGSLWEFSVKDQAIIDKLNESMRSGKRVQMRYCERYFVFPWEGDTKYYIVEVTE